VFTSNNPEKVPVNLDRDDRRYVILQCGNTFLDAKNDPNSEFYDYFSSGRAAAMFLKDPRQRDAMAYSVFHYFKDAYKIRDVFGNMQSDQVRPVSNAAVLERAKQSPSTIHCLAYIVARRQVGKHPYEVWGIEKLKGVMKELGLANATTHQINKAFKEIMQGEANTGIQLTKPGNRDTYKIEDYDAFERVLCKDRFRDALVTYYKEKLMYEQTLTSID